MTTYTLKAGGASATIKSVGGELASYIPAGGREMIWNGNPDVWASHSPLLFPVVGSTVDEKIKIVGKEYSLTKHGFTRKMEFTRAHYGADFIEMTLKATPETKKSYPFDFTVHIVHVIEEKGFRTTFVVDNDSDTVMPMCIGGHPGFMVPMQDGEKFEDYVLEFPNKEDGINKLAPNGYIITGEETIAELAGGNRLALDHKYFDARDALIFASLKSRSVKLIHKDTGKGLRFDFPKFEVLGVWSAPNKNAPYVCLEPWNGLPAIQGETGNMEDKPFVKMVEPGASYQTGYSVTLID